MRITYTDSCRQRGGYPVEVSGLRHSYGGVAVLDGIDLRADAGTVLCLLGPNGAGKTTAIRVMSTLLRPDAGTVRIAGHDAVHAPHEVRARIALTGQYAALDLQLTGTEQLTLLGQLRGLARAVARRRADELLDRFELSDAARRRVGTYSGGMRRRLDLAASLVVPPVVLFLDEPTTGLDPRSRRALWEIVRELTSTGTTVVLTTQYLDEAEQLSDRIALLDHGNIAAEGSAETLRARFAEERVELHAASGHDLDALAAAAGHTAITIDTAALRLTCSTTGTASDVLALLARLDPQHSRVLRFGLRRATLDDVFLAVTGPHQTRAPQPDTKETTHA